MFSTQFNPISYWYLLFLVAFSSLTVGKSNAGSLPFPQNVDYSYGIQPTNADHNDAMQAYEYWKTFYKVQVNDTLASITFNDKGETVSEAIAYGMLLSAYADDKEFFDDLWRYYKKYTNDRGLMHWRIGPTGNITGYNAATDAEEDAAMGLIVADKQWGSSGDINYKADAIQLINAMMAYEVEKPSFVLKPGDVWGGSDVTNISYFAPAYYRIYHQLTGDDRWLNVIDTCYAIIARNAHPVTGLVSDWCKADGTQAGNRGYDHYYDATRFPWRIATDYLWFGVEEAQSYCMKMSNFVKNNLGGSKNIGGGYKIDGTPLDPGHPASFVGPFAVAAMGTDGSYQNHLNSSYRDVVDTSPGGYFDASMRLISLFVLTGNFYRVPDPECRKPDLRDDVSLCDASFYTLSTNLDSKNTKFRWSTGETTPTINVSKPGTYIVSTDSLGCFSADTILVTGLSVNLGPDRQIPLTGINLDGGVTNSQFSYKWSTGENTQSIYIDTVGTYWLEVDSSGCVASDTVTFTFEQSTDILIYPNPAIGGKTNILLKDIEATEVRVLIYSERGELIQNLYSGEVVIGQPKTIQTDHLASGIYFIKVMWNGNEKVKKLLVP